MFKVSIVSLLVKLFLASVTPVNSHNSPIVFSKLPPPVALLEAASDMTATYVEDLKGDGIDAILIVGGCSGEEGNQGVEIDGVMNYFCNKISKGVYAFYPSTEEVVQLADMPFERYRHSAALVNGKLYVIGGRTFNVEAENYDALVKDIIVYDPRDGPAGSWETFMTLDDAHAASDHTSFGKGGNIYVLGGYDAFYNTRADFFSVNVLTQNIVPLKSMNQPRGDAQAAYYTVNGADEVYIMGGFYDGNGFCEPLDHAEKYNFLTNTWTDIDPLINKRGDKGVVVFKGMVIAIGGEEKHESICAGTSDTVDPSSHAVAVDDVESYHPQDGSAATWEVESDFEAIRFRAAATAVEKLSKIYVFGGQMAHDPSCNCYKVSSDIFQYYDDQSAASTKSLGFVAGIVITSIVTMLW